MALRIGVARETAPGERRVALTPETCRKLVAAGASVSVERGLGALAHFPDQAYATAGAMLVDDAAAAIGGTAIVLCVQAPPPEVLATLDEGTVLVGQLQPEADPARAQAIRTRRLVAFPLERLPRTTRAQAMDVLSSQAGMAGYKAVLIAAQLAPRFFPMLTTAAGTIRPSKVLVIGAGVAGLQAVATARRLGAQVECFDVRPETREQIESLGGRFLDLGVSAAGEGGYARALTDEEARRARSAWASTCGTSTPSSAPRRCRGAGAEDRHRRDGAGMAPGSVIVDLAAETGGNCELTRRARRSRPPASPWPARSTSPAVVRCMPARCSRAMPSISPACC